MTNVPYAQLLTVFIAITLCRKCCNMLQKELARYVLTSYSTEIGKHKKKTNNPIRRHAQTKLYRNQRFFLHLLVLCFSLITTFCSRVTGNHTDFRLLAVFFPRVSFVLDFENLFMNILQSGNRGLMSLTDMTTGPLFSVSHIDTNAKLMWFTF